MRKPVLRAPSGSYEGVYQPIDEGDFAIAETPFRLELTAGPFGGLRGELSDAGGALPVRGRCRRGRLTFETKTEQGLIWLPGHLLEQQEVLRERMVRQFAAADRVISQSNSTLSFIQSQIAVWNAESN